MALGFGLFGACGAVIGAIALTPDTREEMSRTGRQSVLAAYDLSLVPVIQVSPVRTLPESELLKRATLVERVLAPRADRGRFAGPFDLPPGRYEVRIWRKVAAADASFWIQYGDGPGVLAEAAAGSENPTVMTLDLPARLSYIWVGARDAEAAQNVTRVEIEPRTLIPRDARPGVSRVYSANAIESRPGRYVFFMDRNTYSEPGAFWVGGEREGRVLVSPGGARVIELHVSNGATAGQVTVSAPGLDETLSMGGRESVTIAIPLDGTELLVPITIGATHGFRPSEVDPTSRDPRWLGCQVAIALL